MVDLNRTVEQSELFNAIKGSVDDGRIFIQKLKEYFTSNVQLLRLEESEETFNSLLENIQSLEHMIEFIKELKNGMSFFDDFGLVNDPISSQDSGLNLFQEMHAAFLAKDWIMLSDLIEYELAPLLQEEDKWLESLSKKMADCEA